MGELISGKDALIALANGERLQYRFPDSIWVDFTNNLNSSGSNLKVVDLLNDYAAFRLKPRTIKIGELEVPAPFEPKEGEKYWTIDCEGDVGDCEWVGDEIDLARLRFLGVYRTMSEAKQVVAALRSVFK